MCLYEKGGMDFDDFFLFIISFCMMSQKKLIECINYLFLYISE